MNEVSANVSLEELIGQVAEEFSERVRQGESPDVQEYVLKYPDAANKLRRILPALALVVDDSTTGEDDNQVRQPIPVPKNGILGDYRLLQELGRGGMGVVYEAEQISLTRKVALKILPFAAVLDQRQIQRFKNEAIAAGQLDHPHIVDVYGVGCERSVHFYAMRYVEGDSLSKVIEQLRRNESVGSVPSHPADNSATSPVAALSTEGTATAQEFILSAARIGIEIAEALDHAHQQGVIHRDVKPANLIIDQTGKSWITDFGLARIEAGVTMTMTGDLLGTLPYMSPEQAMAKRVVVDHRTDVYSLGVTLYELLTLEPAFSGGDRHELLRKIAFEVARPLRKRNQSVPGDLETIILKAIRKNPNERYETAQDMADDLKRFVDGQPISAGRPTFMQELTNWSRRHWRVVWSAAVLLILMTAGFAVSTALIWSEQWRTETALEQARTNYDLAEENARKARIAADRAELHLALALLVIEKAPSNDVRTRLNNGSAKPEALIEVAQKLVERFPQDRSAWKLLSEAYDAANRHEEALAHFQRYATDNPNSAEAHNRLAWLLANCPDVKLRNPKLAVETADKAVEIDPNNSWFLNTLGVAHYRAEETEKARDAFEKSVANGWDDGFNSFFLAMCYWELGDRHRAEKAYKTALEKQKSALPIAGRELRRIRQEADELMGAVIHD